MKKKFFEIIKKDGFYIILFVCVCVVAITAVWTSKNNLNKAKEEKIIMESKKIEDNLKDEPSLTIGKFEEKEKIEDEKPIEKKEKEPKKVEPLNQKKTPSIESREMIVPVDGAIGLDFTKENLVYSSTLEEWISHDGIDFYAPKGTIVVASESGLVKEIYEDELWGIVIILDHGNGLLTKYANLQVKNMVKEGQRVNKGDSISKVGETALIEKLDEPHLHFEVLKDGVSVDPRKYVANIK